MKLEAWRNKNDVSRSAFAEKVKITEETVRRYENGERIPTRAIMYKITEATLSDVTAGDFYGPKVDEKETFRTNP